MTSSSIASASCAGPDPAYPQLNPSGLWFLTAWERSGKSLTHAASVSWICSDSFADEDINFRFAFDEIFGEGRIEKVQKMRNGWGWYSHPFS